MRKFDTALIRDMIRGSAKSYNDAHLDRKMTVEMIEGISKRASRMIYKEFKKRYIEKEVSSEK